MKIILILVSILLTTSAFAQRTDPACNEFRYIQRTMNAINAQSVDRVIPHADWVDEKYRRKDAISAGTNVAKIVILALIGRLNVFTLWLTPSRAEAATITGMYVRNPQNYARFLQLPPERACFVLRLGGTEGDLLREITHEVYLELRRSSR